MIDLIDPHYQNNPEYRGGNILSMPPKWSMRSGCYTILVALVIMAVLIIWNLPEQPVKEPKDGWATILPKAKRWKLRFADTFETDAGDWVTESQRTSLADRNFQVVNGKYRLEILARQPLTVTLGPGAPTDMNFYVAVDGRPVGAEKGAYGLAFHAIHSQYYVFIISCDAYSFQAIQSDESRVILDWTKTSAIQPGQTNRLAVVGADSHYVFFINDQYVGEADDDEFSSGSAIVFFAVTNGGDTGIYEFDNYELRSP